MSMRKRALASSSSGQPSQPKRPCFPPTEEESDGRSWLTKEDLRTVIREELQRAKSDFVEYCQSFVRSAVEEILQEMHSMENDSKKLKEAVESANIHAFHLGRANAKSMAKNDARNLQLQLQTKLSLPLFTGKKLEGEGGARIHVALIDMKTGGVVTSGPESSIKLDVVVLEGDFNKDDEENWTQEEFENYVVEERKGKRPLVMGNLQVTLKGGVGEMGEVIFTDNSSWNRSGRFRIGLKVALGFCGNTRIREAITDAFPVKEHRGEANRKHYPPAPDDKVWRLEKIARDGPSHHKLSEAGICTVEDFLLQLFIDQVKLRKILGKSITQNKWDSLICHAKTCKTKWKLYWDNPDGVTKYGAVFNTDGQPIGLVKDGEYFATHRLSAQEKEHGDTIVKKALANWNDLKEFSGETFSDSMQNNGSSSFASQVFGGQIENFYPFPSYLALPIFADPVGPEAPLANVGSTAEGLNGAMALTLPAQLQNNNSGNSREISVDEYFPLAAHQPMSTDHLNVLIPPGYHGSTIAGCPTQSHGIHLQNAMPSQTIDSLSQVDCAGYDNVLPEGHHEMEDFQSIDVDDLDKWFPDIPLFDMKTGGVVTSGPESSIELDVVVHEGDFNKDDEENWTQEEFENYVVEERKGKRPLVMGNLQVTLKGGVGEMGEVIFTDNSSWNRSGRFRIGLKVALGFCGC